MHSSALFRIILNQVQINNAAAITLSVAKMDNYLSIRAGLGIDWYLSAGGAIVPMIPNIAPHHQRKYNKVMQFLQGRINQPVWGIIVASDVSCDPSYPTGFRFVDGNHRFAVMRDLGITQLEVFAPQGDAHNLVRDFG
jgi:hypothetical protein